MKYKRIPVSAAKEIAQKYDKNQVIILTWDEAHGMTHVTTYGVDKKQCKQAADGGKRIVEFLGLRPKDS